jgi:hypothetical protein
MKPSDCEMCDKYRLGVVRGMANDYGHCVIESLRYLHVICNPFPDDAAVQLSDICTILVVN